MDTKEKLDRKEITERELSRYPDERIEDIPKDYLEPIHDYISESEKCDQRLERALGYESRRRKRHELRLDEVPDVQDLFQIQKYSDRRNLYERKARMRSDKDENQGLEPLHNIESAIVRQHASNEIDVRRTHQFMEYLDTDYFRNDLRLNNPSQFKKEDGTGLLLDVTNSKVCGMKYEDSEMLNHEAIDQLYMLVTEAAETKRKMDEEPDIIGGLGDTTFFSLAKRHADLLESCGLDVDKEEIKGNYYDDFEEKHNHLVNESKKAFKTLRDIGVTYFEIEGFHVEETSSLIDHLSVREGFESERIPSFEDTDMNSEEWRDYHQERLRENKEEGNPTRSFFDKKN